MKLDLYKYVELLSNQANYDGFATISASIETLPALDSFLEILSADLERYYADALYEIGWQKRDTLLSAPELYLYVQRENGHSTDYLKLCPYTDLGTDLDEVLLKIDSMNTYPNKIKNIYLSLAITKEYDWSCATDIFDIKGTIR